MTSLPICNYLLQKLWLIEGDLN